MSEFSSEQPNEAGKETLTEKELYREEITKRLKSIDTKLKFFYWLTIIVLGIYLMKEWINFLIRNA
jgi:hypothetical protein